MKNSIFSFAAPLVLALVLTGMLQAKPVAYIYSLAQAEKIHIKSGNATVKAVKYANLDEGTVIQLGEGAAITIFLGSGKKVAFDQKAQFRITAGGVEALDGETRNLLAAKGEVLVRPIGGSRDSSPAELPEVVKRELDAIEKGIADPAARSLFKIECYNKYGMKKRAQAEYENYRKIAAAK